MDARKMKANYIGAFTPIEKITSNKHSKYSDCDVTGIAFRKLGDIFTSKYLKKRDKIWFWKGEQIKWKNFYV